METFDDLTPPRHQIFRPLIETPLESVRVVIFGRDPHLMPGHHDGLAYSSPIKSKFPDDFPLVLRNVLVEHSSDLRPNRELRSGSLLRWAKQGVLLWNIRPFHRKPHPTPSEVASFETLTEEIIDTVWLNNPRTVFVLWHPVGISKSDLPENSLVVESPGPWSTSANFGFFGSQPFSKVNTLLREVGAPEVDWRLR